MRFFIAIFLGVLLLPNVYGGGEFHIHRSYDLDNDGQSETLVLNSRFSSAMWVEISPEGINDTLWSYSLGGGGTFADGEVVDVNNDAYEDLILIPNLNVSIGEKVWFYIFLGNKNGGPLFIDACFSYHKRAFIRPHHATTIQSFIGPRW